MNANEATVGRWNQLLETMAAELTEAAYPVALRHGAGEKWLELELDLWRALADTIKKWLPESPGAPVRPDAVRGAVRDRLDYRPPACLPLSK